MILVCSIYTSQQGFIEPLLNIVPKYIDVEFLILFFSIFTRKVLEIFIRAIIFIKLRID